MKERMLKQTEIDEVVHGAAPSPHFLAQLASTLGDDGTSESVGCNDHESSDGTMRCRHQESSSTESTSSPEVKRAALLAKEKSWNARWQRFAGPFIVLANYLAIAFMAHTYFFVSLPWFGFSDIVRMILSAPALVLLLRLCYDYALAAFTPPSRPKQLSERELVARSARSVEETNERWCFACDGVKPARCHHCKICRCCVTKMDHHCIFIANCTGEHNMHHFVFALAGAVSGLCTVTLWTFPLLIEVACINSDSPYGGASLGRRMHVLIAFVTELASLYFLTPLLWNTLECIFSNETTIEGLGNKTHKRERPYFRGYYESFVEVFGEVPQCCGERGRSAVTHVGWLLDDNDFRL